MLLAEAVRASTNHNFLNKSTRNLNIIQWQFQNSEFIKRMQGLYISILYKFKKMHTNGWK